jgi:hypothetical protein
MIRPHFWILPMCLLPMCLWTRAAVLTNSILPPAAGRCGRRTSRTDAFLDLRLAAMSVRNFTSVFRTKRGCSRPGRDRSLPANRSPRSPGQRMGCLRFYNYFNCIRVCSFIPKGASIAAIRNKTANSELVGKVRCSPAWIGAIFPAEGVLHALVIHGRVGEIQTSSSRPQGQNPVYRCH